MAVRKKGSKPQAKAKRSAKLPDLGPKKGPRGGALSVQSTSTVQTVSISQQIDPDRAGLL